MNDVTCNDFEKKNAGSFTYNTNVCLYKVGIKMISFASTKVTGTQ